MENNLTIKEKVFLVDSIFEKARLFDVKKIRVFSNIGSYDNTSVDKLINDPVWKHMINIAARDDVVILMENEPLCTINSIDHLKEFLYKTEQYKHHIMVWLDISNLYLIKSHWEYSEIYDIINRIGYIHVKDYIIKSGRVYYVPVGKGLINYKDYFNILFNEEHVISIETHALDSPSKVTYSQMSVDTIKEYEKEYNYDKH